MRAVCGGGSAGEGDCLLLAAVGVQAKDTACCLLLAAVVVLAKETAC